MTRQEDCTHEWEITDYTENTTLSKCKLCGVHAEHRLVPIKSEEKALSIPISPELREIIKQFKEEWYQAHKAISHEDTPLIDGDGRKIVKKRPDNKDYIDDAWMRDRLNKYFPGWSWEMAAPLHFLGAEWVVAQGHLIISDEYLLLFNINPPQRKYYGVDSVRIQYKQNSEHVPENIIDVGDNCQSAVTGAMKRSINRLCGIGDDIYGKRVEEEGAGTEEDILQSSSISINSKHSLFSKFITENNIRPSEVYGVLDITKLSEITDYKKAHDTLLAWKRAGRPIGEKLVAWKKGGDDKSTTPVQPRDNLKEGE